MKLKDKLKALGFAGLISLTSCSTITPKGGIDVAYVTGKDHNQEAKNEIITEIDFGLEGKIDCLKTRIGGRHRAYIDLSDKSIWYDKDEYDVYAKMEIRDLELYLTHTFFDLDKPLNDGMTTVGARIEF